MKNNTLEEILLHANPIEVYQMVLKGDLPRFPRGFWTSPLNTDYSATITKYLIEDILGWSSDEQIKENLCSNVFKKNKLGGLLSNFDGSPYAVINNAYPERFKPWELRVIPIDFNDKEIAIKATKWLIEDQLKLSLPDDLKMLKREHFYDYQVSFILSHYNSLYDCLSNTYPELDIKKYHFGKVPNGQADKENAIESIKDYLSNVLKITSVDEVYNLVLSDFKDKRVSPAIRFFGDQYKAALIEVYGDELKPWLFKAGVPLGYFKEKSNRIKALKWLIYEKLQLDINTIYQLTGEDFKKNKLERMFADYYRNNLDKMFLELFGVSRNEYFNRITKANYTKVFSKSECTAGTYIILPGIPFNSLLDREEITVILDDKELCVGKIKDLGGCFRITGVSSLYKESKIVAGDNYFIKYEKGNSYLHICSK